MNITELSDEELKVFLKGQPVVLLRDVFTNFNSLKNKIRGFRPNKAPLDVLVQTSFNIIRREKNANLIDVLERQYNSLLRKLMKESKGFKTTDILIMWPRRFSLIRVVATNLEKFIINLRESP